MKRKLVILDPGHGGINPITCQYETGNKKMFKHPGKYIFHDGSKFYEGVFNRDVVKAVMVKLALNNIPYVCTIPPNDWHKDISLKKRTMFANSLMDKFDCVFISFHANAFDGWVRGYEVHYDFNDEYSGKLAKRITNYTKHFFHGSELKFRENKNSPKFYVLKNTNMPSVLIEHGYFDNIQDALFLKKVSTHHFFADAVTHSILDWYND